MDRCIHNRGVQSGFGNNPESTTAMLEWSLDTSGVPKDELLFVFEHTGLYAHQLIGQLADNGFHFHVVPGLEIKRSLGIARGKDDKSDTRRITLYGYRTREEKSSVQAAPGVLEKVKRLMSLRIKLVAERAGHITTLGEHQRVLG